MTQIETTFYQKQNDSYKTAATMYNSSHGLMMNANANSK